MHKNVFGEDYLYAQSSRMSIGDTDFALSDSNGALGVDPLISYNFFTTADTKKYNNLKDIIE